MFFIIHQIRANDRYIYIYKEEKKTTEAHGTPPLLFQGENKLLKLNSLSRYSLPILQRGKPHSPITTL